MYMYIFCSVLHGHVHVCVLIRYCDMWGKAGGCAGQEIWSCHVG